MESFDLHHILQIFGHATLILVTLTFIIQYIYPLCKKLFSRKLSSQTDSLMRNEDELKVRQQEANHRLQEKYIDQVDAYKQRVLNPRQEQRQREKEEKFRRFMGPAWKGTGITLGGDIPPKEVEGSSSSQQAAQNRRPLESEQQLGSDTLFREKKRKKRVVLLPEEPPVGSVDCVTVVLRTPLGKDHRRRFYRTCTVQVLLDYMTTIGFPQEIYTLSTSFPRQDLSHDPTCQLYLIPLAPRVLLNVEEKDIL